MSLLSRSDSSRTTPGERVEPLVLGDDRRLAQHRGGAQDRGERRAQFVADRTDQRFAQQLGLGAHLGVVDGARDVETLERGGGVGQQIVDPLADLGDGVAPARCRDRSRSRRSRDSSATRGAPARCCRCDRRPSSRDWSRPARAAISVRTRSGTAFSSGISSCVAASGGAEQHDLAPDQVGEVILDRRRRFPRPSARRRAGARTHRDRSSRFRACGRSRSAASSSWRDGSSPPRPP